MFAEHFCVPCCVDHPSHPGHGSQSCRAALPCSAHRAASPCTSLVQERRGPLSYPHPTGTRIAVPKEQNWRGTEGDDETTRRQDDCSLQHLPGWETWVESFSPARFARLQPQDAFTRGKMSDWQLHCGTRKRVGEVDAVQTESGSLLSRSLVRLFYPAISSEYVLFVDVSA